MSRSDLSFARNRGHHGQMLLIQSLPLMALVVLLASGRASPFWSCLMAAGLALPTAWLGLGSGAALIGFVSRSVAEGVWLAVIPVGIITAGLVFHGCVQHQQAARPAVTPGHLADELFTIGFLLGPFSESVTGFGVGLVFASGAIRMLGISGAPAAAIALMAQTIIPWGGLGPGTAIGAALAGIEPQALGLRSAWLLAPTWLLLLPLFWWWCQLAGVAVSLRCKLSQSLWLSAMACLLIACHWLLPWQICGMVASGLVVSVRMVSARPPRGWDDCQRMAKAAAPYVLLAGLLLSAQLWPHPPAWRPFVGLPSLPLNHAMVALWASAVLMLAATGHGPRFALAAIKRSARPALALLSFVVLARVLANAGIPVALAAALVGGFGAAAPFAAPVLAIISGFFAGTNVASNSAMMPLQAALGRAAGLGASVLPGVQNGTLALVISPQLASVAMGLAGDGVTLARIWRIMWPVALIALAVGTLSIVIG